MDFKWTTNTLDMRTFVKGYSNRFPIIIRVTEGFCGIDDEDEYTFAKDEELRVTHLNKQPRIIVRDSIGRHISIPSNHPMRFHLLDDNGEKVEAQRLSYLVERLQKDDQMVAEKDSNVDFWVGIDRRMPKKLGNLTFVASYPERYLVANLINEGDLDEEPRVIPVYASIKVVIAEGLKSGSLEECEQLKLNFAHRSNGFKNHLANGNLEIMLFEGKVSDYRDYDYVKPRNFLRTNIDLPKLGNGNENRNEEEQTDYISPGMTGNVYNRRPSRPPPSPPPKLPDTATPQGIRQQSQEHTQKPSTSPQEYSHFQVPYSSMSTGKKEYPHDVPTVNKEKSPNCKISSGPPATKPKPKHLKPSMPPPPLPTPSADQQGQGSSQEKSSTPKQVNMPTGHQRTVTDNECQYELHHRLSKLKAGGSKVNNIERGDGDYWTINEKEMLETVPVASKTSSSDTLDYIQMSKACPTSTNAAGYTTAYNQEISPTGPLPSKKSGSMLRSISNVDMTKKTKPIPAPRQRSNSTCAQPVSKHLEVNPVEHMSVLEVGQLLEEIQLHEFKDLFERDCVDGSLLCDLTEDILKSVYKFNGVQAKKVMKCVKEGWRPKKK